MLTRRPLLVLVATHLPLFLPIVEAACSPFLLSRNLEIITRPFPSPPLSSSVPIATHTHNTDYVDIYIFYLCSSPSPSSSLALAYRSRWRSYLRAAFFPQKLFPGQKKKIKEKTRRHSGVKIWELGNGYSQECVSTFATFSQQLFHGTIRFCAQHYYDRYLWTVSTPSCSTWIPSFFSSSSFLFMKYIISWKLFPLLILCLIRADDLLYWPFRDFLLDGSDKNLILRS